ncbi:hypothetical protein V0R50_15945 [Pseudomonas sp. 148P]|jgi:hypothetical protein|uniref:Uncharacterized protein n=1 Tax=Pseudomonas ulcerans TaxID=3115852 RepID=A0ABU7HT46_9PSED|nr:MULTISPECIES: hypothetical protein [unclassified Pseudomonas]MDR0280103.1 hypothetical protein [Paucimonas sp.]MEE1924949.1 hypothetical protein [Pseudomonas sp. 147P]MEE1934722.1 hypothetical protein [Pseudomonas sp. 148P]
MFTFPRLALLLLVVGMLLGEIVLASIGLVGVCTAAVLADMSQDPPAPEPTTADFIA